jgi:hypothetical protein
MPSCTDVERPVTEVVPPAVKSLPVYRVGPHEDIVNLQKLADFVGWTDLKFETKCAVRGFFENLDGTVEIERLDTREKTTEEIGVENLSLGILKDHLIPRHCVVLSHSASVKVGGLLVHGTLQEDGWHGTLSGAIELANDVVTLKLEEIRNSPQFKTKRIYPRSMWR